MLASSGEGWPEVYIVWIAFKSVVVETCDDCWPAELRFRGNPGPDEVFEYIDIRLLPDMARVVGDSVLPVGVEAFC